jgi:hypothetical protein
MLRFLASILLSYLAFLLASCETTNSGAKGGERQNVAASSVDNWRLPVAAKLTITEIDALRQDPAQTERLRTQLSDGPSSARTRAAHAIEKLGGKKELEPALVAALRQDNDPVSRVFICRALAATETDQADTLSALQEVYRHTPNPVVKTYAAGAIVCHTDGQAQNELQHLLDRLDPLSLAPAGNTAANQFWERRWASAYMIARLGRTGTPLIPNVERATEALVMPDWVERQLFLTLRQLSR